MLRSVNAASLGAPRSDASRENAIQTHPDELGMLVRVPFAFDLRRRALPHTPLNPQIPYTPSDRRS